MTNTHERLTSDYERLNLDHLRLNSQYHSLSCEFAAASVQHQDTTSKLDVLTTRNLDLASQYELLTLKHQKLTYAHRFLLDQYDSLRVAQQADQAELQKREEEIQRQGACNYEWLLEAERMKAIKIAWENELSAMERECSTLKLVVWFNMTFEISDLRKQLQAAKKELEDRGTRLWEAKKDNASLDVQLRMVLLGQTYRDAKITELEATAATAKELLEATAEAKQTLLTRCCELEAAAALSNCSLSESQTACAKSTEELNKAREIISSLTQTCAEREAERIRLEDLLAGQRREVGQLRSSMSSLEMELTRERADRIEVETRVSDQAKLLQTLELRTFTLKKTSADLYDARTSLSAANATIAKALQDNTFLESQLQTRMADLNQLNIHVSFLVREDASKSEMITQLTQQCEELRMLLQARLGVG